MDLSLSDSLTVHPDTVFRLLDDESVLLNLKSGTYFGLDPVGTRMWQLLVEHGTLARVCDELAREYVVDREVLERDLLSLGRQLCDRELMEAQRKTGTRETNGT
jgi:Coenzyme PQQ synthesis protein D (PqqD)